MRTQQKLNSLSMVFSNEGFEFPVQEAEAIIAHVLDTSKVSIIRDDPEITTEKEKKIDQYVQRRLSGEPLQYITGVVEFLDMNFKVGKGVLIPRPETELLILTAINLLTNNREGKVHSERALQILDLCTGSGCMAVSLALRFRDAQVIATDVSEEALRYARDNARQHNRDNIAFLQGDLFLPIGKRQFDLIVSNPPYIRSSEIPSLQREIRDWEPVLALDGGHDGLNVVRQIISQLHAYLKHVGYCLLEIGHDQAGGVRSIAEANGLSTYFIKDMAGYDRIAVIQWKSRYPVKNKTARSSAGREIL